MSYMQFQQRCRLCDARWNAAFGIVGTTQIAAPPTHCPHCGSGDMEKVSDNWDFTAYSDGKPIEEFPPDINAVSEPIFDPERVMVTDRCNCGRVIWGEGKNAYSHKPIAECNDAHVHQTYVFLSDYDKLLALYREAMKQLNILRECENHRKDMILSDFGFNSSPESAKTRRTT